MIRTGASEREDRLMPRSFCMDKDFLEQKNLPLLRQILSSVY